ncbi:HIRAN domain-containing protein [Paracoccus litorisediminis]|uniref:HIRAN domain-containing protein n=1 Tax=Paracoccus litorisediminis TaxID=2006130 RepID=UPI0037326C45
MAKLTPALVGEAEDALHARFPIAGLQFYDYNRSDELIGQIRPKSGDRLLLIRKPENRHDANAIEIWWREGQHKLGHVPRDVACHLAPAMDAGGEMVRAYAESRGNGAAWSIKIMIVGEAIPEKMQPQRRHAPDAGSSGPGF